MDRRAGRARIRPRGGSRNLDGRSGESQRILLLLMFSAPALMALFGFGRPRCFLWLAPAVAMLLTMFFDRQIQQGYYGRVLLLLSLALAAPYSAIANVNFGTHPFKRNSVYPLSEHLGFHSQQRDAALKSRLSGVPLTAIS